MLPEAQIRVNPTLGLVNLPSWFWVEGYQGATFTRALSLPSPPYVPMTVEVRVYPQQYLWQFGDGSPILQTTSLGLPYPAESEVAHTYRFSSLNFPEGFPLMLVIEWGAEYRVDGGAPQALPPLRRTYLATHQVQEIQPIITNP